MVKKSIYFVFIFTFLSCNLSAGKKKISRQNLKFFALITVVVVSQGISVYVDRVNISCESEFVSPNRFWCHVFRSSTYRSFICELL